MEAVGVGANVLAFVVLGIKSAKLTHDTLSAIKDGPALVQSVAANFLQLHWILEQLLQCRAAAADPALHGQAQQCCENLDKLAKTIERLQVPPREKATGKFWKRLKTAISENDLKRLDAWAAQQASMLNLRLNVLSSNVLYATRDGNERIQQQIHSFGTSIQTQFESQTASFLGAARNIMSSHTDDRSALEAGLSSIQETIEATHSISSEDTRSMFQLLQEIKDRVAPESENDVEMTNLRGDDEQAPEEAAPGLDQKLLQSINSLGSLIDEKRDAVDVYAEDDDQAESVIENLKELVGSLQKQNLPVRDPMSFDNGLRRFGRSFGSKILSINSGVRTSRRPLTRVLEQTHTLSEADVRVGTLSLRVQKRKRAVGADGKDDEDATPRKRCHTDWMMALTFLPGRGQNHHMVVASITQQERFMGSVSSISHLQVYRTLPEGSPVFELVRVGDLEGLRKMLQEGRASLRDHDEYGASLLFFQYSIEHPEVCKFLIESGLDVDHVASDYGYRGFKYGDEDPVMKQALQVADMNDDDMDPEILRRVTESRRLLLRAGADPTLHLCSYAGSFLEGSIETNVPETIELAWNPEFVAPFADIKTYRTRFGSSVFLDVCHNYSDGFNKETIHRIFQLGANVHDRDEQGRSCLHICFDNLMSPRPDSVLREFEVIEYLMRKGTDPRAVDNHGRSVSDIAYTTNGRLRANCSYAGDLWDAVLHRCGYDISQFRSGYRRRARYTTLEHNRRWSCQYTRRSFERLWEGRGAECPYWDDEPWPPLGPEEEDSDDESQDLTCSCRDCRISYLDMDEEESESGSDLECSCRDCRISYLDMDEEESESGSDLDTEEDEEQASSNDADCMRCPRCFQVLEDGEQSEPDIGEDMSTGDVESYGEETGTFPGFGELMQDVRSENWQDSPGLQQSIGGTPRSLSMDLDNPWL